MTSSKLEFTPSTTAAMTITTTTPMDTPRIVSPLRTLFANSESVATRMPSRRVASSPIP